MLDVTIPQRTAPKARLEHVATGIRLEEVSKGRLAWKAIISVKSATARAGFSIARRP